MDRSRNTHTRRRSALAVVLALIASVVALMGAGATAGSASAATCSTSSTGGTVTRFFWMDWTQGFRSYNLRVPAGITGNAPLLIDLHGLGSNAFFQEVTSGWDTHADAQKFIVAYPAGSAWGQAWNPLPGSADVAFLRRVVADIRATYCVDPKRIYSDGGSLGGFMSQRLACDAEDLFASIVATISGPVVGTCSLSRPVSVAVVNTEGDPLFPTAQSIASRDAWLARNSCSTSGTTEPNAYGANGQVYSDCDGDAAVLWRTYAGTSHSYPTGAALSDYHSRIWSFLMAHPKP